MELSDWLADNGPLADAFDGFAARPEQQAMASAVSNALEDAKILVVEAGTGTGKTFAYLVPALLSGRRVVISTGTRHLQDQLFHRDLPVVRSALKIPVNVALLKGRSNYLCDHRLNVTRAEGRLKSREQQNQLEKVHDWSGRTQSGDIAELTHIAEDSPIWSKVTSTTDNCLGPDCSWHTQCHVLKARRNAMDAEVIVINHHLLFADMALKDEGFGELLPHVDAIIVDEAHQLPETATRFFGTSLTSRQLFDYARDCVTEYVKETGLMSGLPDHARQLEHSASQVRLAMGQTDQRAGWNAIANKPDLKTALDELQVHLSELTKQISQHASLSRGLENCFKRGQLLGERLLLTTMQPPGRPYPLVRNFSAVFSYQPDTAGYRRLFSGALSNVTCYLDLHVSHLVC